MLKKFVEGNSNHLWDGCEEKNAVVRERPANLYLVHTF